MKIKQLQLQNYGRFEDLTVDFAPTDERKGNVTIIVGNNGAGKSQILQALVTTLGYLINNILSQPKPKVETDDLLFYGNSLVMNSGIPLKLIKNKKDSVELSLIYSERDSVGKIVANTERKSFISNELGKTNVAFLKEIKSLLEYYENGILGKELINFPILALYNPDRSISKIEIDYESDAKSHQIVLGYLCYGIAEAEYNRFFRWFREKEDLENEHQGSLALKITEALKFNHDKNELEIIKNILKDSESKDNSLRYVRQAIEYFTGFEKIHIERQGTPTMIVEKDGEELDVNQLSQGEKSLLALVGDIARRLAILNPSLDDPLQGEGVVMIDEVDLHLHPKWQHDLIDKLVRTFPNVQFILTTHSPLIVSDRADILVYLLDDGNLRSIDNIYGEDANTLLNDIFYVPPRTPEVEETFNGIRRAISHKELESAESQINNIAKKVSSSNTELLKVRLMLAQAKLAQNKVS